MDTPPASVAPSPSASAGPRLRSDGDFVRLWSAGTVSIFGSLIGRTALPFVAILTLHAGAIEVASIRSVELVAGLVVGLFAGAWVDRLRRRPVMIASDLGRAVLLATIPIAAALGVLSLGQLLVVVFLWAVLTTFFDLADRAYLPTLVSAERLVGANSALTASSSVAEFTGFGIAGVLVQVLSAPFAVVIDAASFVASAILVRSIRRPEPPPPDHTDREPVLHEIREGLSLVRRTPALRALALSSAFLHIVYGVFGAIYFLYVSQVLGLEPAAIGVIAAVGGIASLFGAVVVGRVARRIGVGATLLVGIAGFGVGHVFMPLAPADAPLVAALLLVASQLVSDSAATGYEILDTSVRQSVVDDRSLGRVNATIGTMSTLLMLVATILTGVAGEVYGLRPVAWVSLGAPVLAFVVIWFSPLRRMREVPAGPLGPAIVGEAVILDE